MKKFSKIMLASILSLSIMPPLNTKAVSQIAPAFVKPAKWTKESFKQKALNELLKQNPKLNQQTPNGAAPNALTQGATDVVQFKDANLAKAVRQALALSSTAAITQGKLATLTDLTAMDLNISDLTGLEYAVNLSFLDVSNNEISNLSVISKLTKLEYLGLGYNQPLSNSSLASLNGLSVLQYLDLSGNNINDVSGLGGVPQLVGLGLSESNFSNLSSLSGLTNLQTLDLTNDAITDISPLSSLTNLESLSLWENNISDISALSNLTVLASLDLESNNITNLLPLISLDNLSYLFISSNPVSDLTPLKDLGSLEFVMLLDMPNLDLTEGSAAMQIISGLMANGIEVEYDGNYDPGIDYGWTVDDEGNLYYYDEDGNMVTGWYDIDGVKYFFDPNTGVLATSK
ncbi:leucine-rich repeat domain-containing protein [Neobacillus sp. NRS-1170]|uniref:leucine-rich repeat domain-containing protein n=1 Tax=Neobacillus sp. NRS-1170 TaxID=3233898 RepID=UPI003D2B1B8D